MPIDCKENHNFFFQTFWKDSLSKKSALEYDLSCTIGKNDVSFSRKYDLTLGRKMKDDLSEKNTWNYDIFFKCSEKMIFSKRLHRNMIFLVLSGKIVFFSQKMMFFLWKENERSSFSRNTWKYGIFCMYVQIYKRDTTPLCQNKLKMILSGKNTPKGDWHSRLTF